jgi:ribonuclease BN (tRNA processing enzyme)
MELIVLGSGTGLPSQERGCPSFFVKAAGIRLLMDMGPGTLRQMSRAGLPYHLLDMVLITHFHPDHVNDLAHLLFALKTPALQGQRGQLKILGPIGMIKFYEGLYILYGKWVDLPPPSPVVLEIPFGDELVEGELRVMTRPTPHTEASIGFRLEHHGKSIVYLGDTDFSLSLIPFLEAADCLILECAFPDEMKGPGHLTPKEVATIASEARPKRLLITHLYPEAQKVDIVTPIRRSFKGELIIARDLMKIVI